MNRMKEVDKIKIEIKRLESYFDKFELFEPSSTTSIEHFKTYYTGLTPDIKDFYTFCNGFDVHTDDYYDGKVISLEEHLELIEAIRSDNLPLFTYQFPILTDGCGNYDCVMFLNGQGSNSVVFRDSDDGLPSYVKANCLSSYFSFLTNDLLLRYNRDGTIKPEYDLENPDPVEIDWPHNSRQMITKDPGLIDLYKDVGYALQFSSPEDLIKSLD
ncbi:MAG: SMI1/KNR4 family protein [Bacteroidia bacterium]|nr:SMI1/KNR4 family protein [Bacteroidia bacterium]